MEVQLFLLTILFFFALHDRLNQRIHPRPVSSWHSMSVRRATLEWHQNTRQKRRSARPSSIRRTPRHSCEISEACWMQARPTEQTTECVFLSLDSNSIPSTTLNSISNDNCIPSVIVYFLSLALLSTRGISGVTGILGRPCLYLIRLAHSFSSSISSVGVVALGFLSLHHPIHLQGTRRLARDWICLGKRVEITRKSAT